MSEALGIEGMTDEDCAYAGSRYSEVRDAVWANPYTPGPWQPASNSLPRYEVTLGRILRGAIASGKHFHFKNATVRTVDSHADLRWGPDRKGFRRLLHPNGVCISGVWEITEDTPYTGYFRKGSRALIIARYSTCCDETRNGHVRSLAMVGKLFPTQDPQHPHPLRTANFFTQEDIGGNWSTCINDAQLLNAPDTTVWRRGLGTATLLVSGLIFNAVDRRPTIRQLYEIAELGKPLDQPVFAPQFMRLAVTPAQPRLCKPDLDFRDEVMSQLFDNGDPTPKRRLIFDIETTDEGETVGPDFLQRRILNGTRRIGRISFDNAVISYNGDFVIHFNHPTWRSNRNDPVTATRMDGKRMR